MSRQHKRHGLITKLSWFLQDLAKYTKKCVIDQG